MLFTLIFASAYSQTLIDSTQITKKVQADRDWESLEYAMTNLLTDAYKNQPTQRLITSGVVSYNDDLIKEVSQLFDTFKKLYPKDKRSASDVQICFNSSVEPYFLPKTQHIIPYSHK
ncbi:hypothetical protein [Flavivirga rizhaonensis]|uniref:Uncharacterized protein n=1 Tax=Flavivirga rizhaonensis TaxID=2559571 RepID=A0A4S1DZE9_9FLAO|nr:hypothetical protein [Flavivirga rizhaonensis]TGV03600.1 hypothetical protein EM932_06125 [Flavivirga rizhaonensis]